jgi:two-component system response regulator NreC
MTSVTVLVADDDELVRVGVVALLKAEPDLQVVGEAADGLEALRLAERLRPSVILLDLMLPGLSGLEVLRQIPSRAPGVRAVILSGCDSPAHVLAALRTGALGYVRKDSHPREVLRALREAAAGRRYFAPPLCEHSPEIDEAQTQTSIPDPYETLTTREREVLHLTAEGRTSVEIGSLLFISPRTVEGHRASLMHKLGLPTQKDVVRYALRRGILLVDD